MSRFPRVRSGSKAAEPVNSRTVDRQQRVKVSGFRGHDTDTATCTRTTIVVQAPGEVEVPRVIWVLVPVNLAVASYLRDATNRMLPYLRLIKAILLLESYIRWARFAETEAYRSGTRPRQPIRQTDPHGYRRCQQQEQVASLRCVDTRTTAFTSARGHILSSSA
jgi:hypothetical protein